MKHLYLKLLLLCCLFSCSSDEKAIDIVLNDVRRGAVLRTVQINNAEFEVNNPESLYSIVLEEQDVQDGGLLEDVSVLISFIDNTPEDGDLSTTSDIFESLILSDFTNGENDLPVINLEYTFAQLSDFTGVPINSINCTDQFRIDLDLNLNNGDTFNLNNAAGTIVNTTGFFRSPFTYLINVIEPIQTNLFTGEYFYTSLEDGFFGATFGQERIFNIEQGHSTNVRQFEFVEGNRNTLIEFSILCNNTEVTRYQKTILSCTGGDQTDKVLIGPDVLFGLANQADDSVFELWFLEAFEGFDAQCNYENFPSKIRLSKQ